MAEADKKLVWAKDGPAPQHYDPTKEVDGDYEYTHGLHNAPFSFPIGATDIAFGRHTIGTTQVELKAGGVALANRRRLRLLVEGSKSLHIGKTGVLVTTGYPVRPGKEFVIDLHPEEPLTLYGIAESDVLVWIIEEA
jgi:hypothetical protein